MIFQYNPLETYLETTADDEVLCTINSTAVLNPRGPLQHRRRGPADLVPRCRGRDHRPRRAGRRGPRLAGRPDAAAAAVPVRPEGQHDLLHGRQHLPAGRRVRPLHRQPPGAPAAEFLPPGGGAGRPGEPTGGQPATSRRRGASTPTSGEPSSDTCRAGVLRHLAEVSRDFAESLAEDPSAADLRVEIHEYGTGPFAGAGSTIKNVYLVRGVPA